MPQGFFSKKETESISAVGGQIHSCASCGLYKDCMSAKMKPYGDFEKGIIIIGEAPGRLEDERGKPWQGKAGRLLRKVLDSKGIDLFRDCISLNSVNCRPPDNETPSTREIDHCRSIIVWPAIQEYQPKVIIPLGSSALQSVIGHRWNGSSSIKKWRGWTIPDQDIKSWVCPSFHPSYILRKDRPKDLMRIWMKDLETAIEKADEKFPRHKSPEIEYVEDLSFLDTRPWPMSAFDYETSGIKPQDEGHRIYTCAIADAENHVWTFPIPKTREGRMPLRRWLADPRIPKIAQNMKFEDMWSKEILKVPVRGWEWDPMLASHILDNRRGIAGLKFQIYANFGVMGYDDKVQQYIRSNSEKRGNNAKNSLHKMMKTKTGRKDLLKYDALDAIYEYRLSLKQMDELDWSFLPF